MKVFVNNEERQLASGQHLLQVLQHAGIDAQRGIAVAVNNTIVPRAQWFTHALHPNDKITIITATQGG